MICKQEKLEGAARNHQSVPYVQAGININRLIVCVIFPLDCLCPHHSFKSELLVLPSPVGLLDVPGTRFARIVAELREEEKGSRGQKLALKHGDFIIHNTGGKKAYS